MHCQKCKCFKIKLAWLREARNDLVIFALISSLNSFLACRVSLITELSDILPRARTRVGSQGPEIRGPFVHILIIRYIYIYYNFETKQSNALDITWCRCNARDIRPVFAIPVSSIVRPVRVSATHFAGDNGFHSLHTFQIRSVDGTLTSDVNKVRWCVIRLKPFLFVFNKLWFSFTF